MVALIAAVIFRDKDSEQHAVLAFACPQLGVLDVTRACVESNGHMQASVQRQAWLHVPTWLGTRSRCKTASLRLELVDALAYHAYVIRVHRIASGTGLDLVGHGTGGIRCCGRPAGPEQTWHQCTFAHVLSIVDKGLVNHLILLVQCHQVHPPYPLQLGSQASRADEA